MRPTIQRLRERANGATILRLRDMARRLAVKLTGEFWQLLGYEDDAGGREVFDRVEAFQGIGYRSRPRSGKGEVLVLNLGESAHPVIVATRDKEIEIEVGEDETAIFNSQSRVIIKSNGEVHVDSGSGAVPLATKADVDALASWAESHVHPGVTAGGASTGTPGAPPSAAGTTVLKGK